MSICDQIVFLDIIRIQLKESRAWLKKPANELTWQTFDTNYRATFQEITMYGIKQRWLLIESKHALARELQAFQRRLDKKSTELSKTLWHLSNQVFKCQSDAEKSIKPLLKSLKYHRIHNQIMPIERYTEKGRPKPGAQKGIVGYQINATFSSCLEKISLEKL